MSVVLETTLGDITIDLFIKERPRACLNFLKLCKIKYYNYNLFHTISRNFIAQTGDPTGSRNGGDSIYGVYEGPLKRYFEAEKQPRIKHTNMGLVSFVGNEECMIGSQFFITLGVELTYLDAQHCVFGEVVEGLDVLELLNEAICDNDNRPYKDIRITHTVVLDDPLPDPKYLTVPERSPSPSAERLQGGRIAPDEEIDEAAGKNIEEVLELQAEREAKARATILEMVGDIPDAEMAPPENVLFVCKLNPVTTDDDLEIIFSRFGKIKSCEVIRDKKTSDSLQYAFVEFAQQKSCEEAYFKMDNVLIDDRRIHVDFSQSVAKIKWHGKGRGVTTYDDTGKKTDDARSDYGNGRYTKQRNDKNRMHNNRQPDKYRDNKPRRDYEPRRYQNYNNYHRNYNNRSDRYYNYKNQSMHRSYDRYSSSKHFAYNRYNRDKYDRNDYKEKDYRNRRRYSSESDKETHKKSVKTRKESESDSDSDDSKKYSAYKKKEHSAHKKKKNKHLDNDSSSSERKSKKKKKKKQQSDSSDSSDSSSSDEELKRKKKKHSRR